MWAEETNPHQQTWLFYEPRGDMCALVDKENIGDVSTHLATMEIIELFRTHKSKNTEQKSMKKLEINTRLEISTCPEGEILKNCSGTTISSTDSTLHDPCCCPLAYLLARHPSLNTLIENTPQKGSSPRILKMCPNIKASPPTWELWQKLMIQSGYLKRQENVAVTFALKINCHGSSLLIGKTNIFSSVGARRHRLWAIRENTSFFSWFCGRISGPFKIPGFFNQI